MSAAEKELLHSTARLHRGLARAAGLARGNAISYQVFGAFTLLLALFGPDFPGLLIGAIVTGVGVAQTRTAPRLRRGDLKAPSALARNELTLMAAAVGYCLLQLTLLRPSGAELQAQLGDTSALGIDVEELTDSVHTLIYSVFLAATLLYQGGLALYFLRRRPLVERYRQEAPRWARETVESLRG